MRHLIHEHRSRISGHNGVVYTARTYAEERADGTWYAWLEFDPADVRLPRLHTEQESSQASRAAVEYWAGGLEPTYLEGALSRAHV